MKLSLIKYYDYSALAATRDVARANRVVIGRYSSTRLLEESSRFEYSAIGIRD